jgi:hypothetical protein
MIANFLIDRPALLEINRKMATMGGGIIILAKKGPIFVWRLSVFGCSRFPPEQKKEEKGARQKKKMEGTNGPDPLAGEDDVKS